MHGKKRMRSASNVKHERKQKNGKGLLYTVKAFGLCKNGLPIKVDSSWTAEEVEEHNELDWLWMRIGQGGARMVGNDLAKTPREGDNGTEDWIEERRLEDEVHEGHKKCNRLCELEM